MYNKQISNRECFVFILFVLFTWHFSLICVSRFGVLLFLLCCHPSFCLSFALSGEFPQKWVRIWLSSFGDAFFSFYSLLLVSWLSVISKIISFCLFQFSIGKYLCIVYSLNSLYIYLCSSILFAISLFSVVVVVVEFVLFRFFFPPICYNTFC